MKERIRLADGCRLSYRFDGPADAPVLLLSNSLGTDMAMWEPQMAALTGIRHVLRYDGRGLGQSDAPAGAYSIDRLGRDVLELLDALDLDQVDVCGLSLGGMVGQWLGVRAPDRVRQLVLANTSSYMGPPAGWDERINLARTAGMEALAEASIGRWFTSGFVAGNPDRIAPIAAMLKDTSPEGYAGNCAAIRDMDQRRTVALVTAPTLVIGGTADPATPPEHAQALVETIPGAELEMLDAAHLSNVEAPVRFSSAVVNFLV